MKARMLAHTPQSCSRVPGLAAAGHFPPRDRHPFHPPPLHPTNQSVPADLLG